jgi:putative ABC transport system permease protein
MTAKVAFKNILHKPLNAVLSLVLLTSSICIISVLIHIQEIFEKNFSNNLKGIDLVMGASGSPLQLILSAVYQIDNPTGNIKLKEAEPWMNHPFVAKAIPLAYGDSYNEYKIVGTTPAYLAHFNVEIAEGVIFTNNFEVVVGADVAKNLNIKIGDKLISQHGMAEDAHAHEDKPYVVTGILKNSGSVADKLLLCTIESVWEVHEEHIHDEEDEDHDHEHSESCTHGHEEEESENESESESESEEVNEDRQITAVIFSFKNKMASLLWPRQINENTSMMMASPAIEINRLFTLFGVGIDALYYLAIGIMFISCLSIFIALYNTLKERKYELALMRVSGANRFQLLSLVLFESIWLCIVGFILGIITSRLVLFLISNATETQYKISFNPFVFNYEKEGLLLVLTIIVGIISAIIPAVKAFRLNISKILANA